ncbi:uncharacterized protein [Chironomus tepperi]|uniref:uncharacterized protein n=1 Tax=Chironomus tepperi TaxID=113505 RepID=UPI00391EFE9E
MFRLKCLYLIFVISCVSASRYYYSEDYSTEHTDSIDSLDSTESEEIKLLKTIVKKECLDYGLKGRISYIKDSTPKCFMHSLSYETIQYFDRAKRTDNYNGAITKACEHKDKFKTCIKTSITELDQCLTEDVITLQNAIFQHEELLDYACTNANKIERMLNDDADDCIRRNQRGIERCFTEALEANKPEKIETFDDIKTAVTQFYCSNAKTLETCIMDKLNSCSQSTIDLAKGAIRIVTNDKICQKLTSSSSLPSLSMFGFIITMLIITIFK